jgi:ankyrin repeat protein
MFAALFSSPEIVTVLIEAGADVNAKSDDGSTSLMFTASGKRYNLAPESVKLLIEAGADVNAKSDDGSTPLMHVEEEYSGYDFSKTELSMRAARRLQIIQLLKAAGARE